MGDVTLRNGTLRDMPLQIDGITYLNASETLEEAGVSRQTLWRWRQEGKIPSGHRYRDHEVLFTREEVEEIKAFANRLEPIGADLDSSQLRLFGGGS